MSTVDAQILFFHPETGQQTASIEGKFDLGYARKETDKVTGKKLTFGRFAESNFFFVCLSQKMICLFNLELIEVFPIHSMAIIY